MRTAAIATLECQQRHLAHYTRSDSRYFTSGRRKSDAMAGFHSQHMYTMEEVIGMIDDVDEPMCEGSDDDFDVDDLIIDDDPR